MFSQIFLHIFLPNLLEVMYDFVLLYENNVFLGRNKNELNCIKGSIENAYQFSKHILYLNNNL